MSTRPDRARGTVHVVLPGDIDDPAAPSGGNLYDRRVCASLAASGWSVRELPVTGTWPRPGAVEQQELAGVLAAVPDGGVVLLDGLVACGVPGVLVPQAGRLRLVVLVHLPLAAETGLAPDVAAGLDALERETLRAVAAVVATSVSAAQHLIARHGLAADRVHVAAPGAQPAPVAPATTAGTRLTCLAAVTPRKGHDVLIEALAAVADLPWSCACVGALDRAPEHVDRLKRSIRAHGLGDRVRFVGPRTGDELAATWAGTDLLVLASRAETFGMVVTEALARAIPVLATDVGGVPEALGRAPDGGLPGMLVPADDPVALAGALRRWLAEVDVRRDLRVSAGARRGTLTDWTDTTRAIARVLEATTPEITNPEITNPDAMTPAATTPAATTPDATTPDATIADQGSSR